MARQAYTAEAIEVLSGLDPVRKRPGMYTDTTRPNHLAQEVIKRRSRAVQKQSDSEKAADLKSLRDMCSRDQ